MSSILTYTQDGLKKKNKYLQKDVFAVWENKPGTAENEEIYICRHIYRPLALCGAYMRRFS
jgi:hypothetical protein